MLQLSGEGHKGEPLEKSVEGRHCFYILWWDYGGFRSAGLKTGRAGLEQERVRTERRPFFDYAPILGGGGLLLLFFLYFFLFSLH